MSQKGFTIIETMIVVAISAILALSAYNLVYGKINKTDFQISITNFKIQLQQIINNSTEGYHPTRQIFSCQAGYETTPQITPISSSYGTNTGCIFLGQAVKFNVGKTSYNTYSVVGNQNYFQVNSANIIQAYPLIVNQTDQSNNLKNQLIFYCIATTIPCSSATSLNELVFLSADSNQNIMDGSNSSVNTVSSQPLTAFYVKNSSSGNISGNIGYSSQLYICLSNGSNTNGSGLITIDNNLIPKLSLKLYNNSTC